MDLQTAFYILGIIFMGLMIILLVALLAAVLVIKAKINRAHDLIETRVNHAKSVAGKVSIGVRTLRHFVAKS